MACINNSGPYIIRVPGVHHSISVHCQLRNIKSISLYVGSDVSTIAGWVEGVLEPPSHVSDINPDTEFLKISGTLKVTKSKPSSKNNLG